MGGIDLRINLRLKLKDTTVFFMIAKTQGLRGVTSLTSINKHFIFWDIEGVTLKEAINSLKQIQNRYQLSNIYIESDNNVTFRAWCFNQVEYKKMIKILSDSLDFIDYNFFYYTVKRRKATLRVSPKKNRETQKVVSILESYYIEPPDGNIEKVNYDTGISKRGISLLVGEK